MQAAVIRARLCLCLCLCRCLCRCLHMRLPPHFPPLHACGCRELTARAVRLGFNVLIVDSGEQRAGRSVHMCRKQRAWGGGQGAALPAHEVLLRRLFVPSPHPTYSAIRPTPSLLLLQTPPWLMTSTSTLSRPSLAATTFSWRRRAPPGPAAQIAALHTSKTGERCGRGLEGSRGPWR